MASSKIYRRLPIGGFKPHQIVKLRYSDCKDLDPGSGASGTAAYVFQANNIFDPDNTGAGHQPLYRDTWAAIYRSYIVLGARIKVYFTPVRNVAVIDSSNIVGDTVPYTIGCSLSDSNTDWPSATNTLVETGDKRRVRWKIIPAMATNKFTSIIQTFSPKKLYGLKDTRDHLSELGAPIGGGPSLAAYFIVFAANADNTDNPPEINFRVVIDYTVMFYDIVNNVSAS